MTEASASVGLLLATALLNNNQNMLAKLTPIIAWLLWGISLVYHNQQQKMKLIPTKQDNYKEYSDLHQSAVVFHGPNTFHTVSKLIKLGKVNYFCFPKPLQEILMICLAGIHWLCERWLFSKCSFRLINLVLIPPA